MKKALQSLLYFIVGFLLYVAGTFPGRWSQQLQLLTIGATCFIAAYAVSRHTYTFVQNLRAILFIALPWMLSVGLMLLERSWETFPTWGLAVPLSIASGMGVKMLLAHRRELRISIVCIWVFLMVAGYVLLPGWQIYNINRKEVASIPHLDEVVFYDKDDQPVYISELKGSIVFLDFWSYTCASCIEGFPNLEALFSRFEHHPDVKVLAVRIPSHSDKLAEAQGFRPDAKFRFPSLHIKDDQLKERLLISSVPTHMLLDKQGHCTFRGVLDLRPDALFWSAEKKLEKLVTAH